MKIEIRDSAESDLTEIIEIVQAAAEADQIDQYPVESEIREYFNNSLNTGEKDAWVAWCAEAGVIAYADGVLRKSEHSALYATRCFIHPSFRRLGLGARLLQIQIRRSREYQRRQPEKKVIVSAKAQDTQPSADRLLRDNGFQETRRYLELERPLQNWVGKPIMLDLELSLVCWKEMREDERLWDALASVFADQLGSPTAGFEYFLQQINDRQVDPDCSFLVRKNGEIIAGILNSMGEAVTKRFHRNMGWVNYLFVSPRWRRRGIGSVLLQKTFEQALAVGHTSVGLLVDEKNPSGAIELYRGEGFLVRSTTILFQRG